MLLTIMNKKWSELRIEEWFVEVHHFRLKQFPKTPPTLATFVDSCDKKRLKGQNFRTIERALEVVRYVKKGIIPSTAIDLAWQRYPLIKAL